MEVTINIDGQPLSVEVTVEVYEYLTEPTTRKKTLPMRNGGTGTAGSLTST